MLRWDIFCKVIDNYGDIGVAWRLARQLAQEHGFAVRLWVDDLSSFQRLVPELETGLEVQQVRHVEIHHWQAGFNVPNELPDVVIEAFGCTLPEVYVAAMAQRVDAGFPQAAWINLEYLSAEAWVESHHGLASPHPRLALTKTFFFPGFTPRTGGLLREAGLVQRRVKFQADAGAQAEFWNRLGLPPPVANELRYSMFAYPSAASSLLPLLQGWATDARPRTLLIPEGVLQDALKSFFGAWLEPGQAMHRGALTVQVFPFLDQDDYDRLLWACDLNFVRGEDSFVQTQWARRPFIWQIYPQEQEVHLTKLEAFFHAYAQAGLGDESRELLRALHRVWLGWNQSGLKTLQWADWLVLEQHLDRLGRHAEAWCERLAAQDDLVTQLLRFLRQPRQA